MPRSRRIFRYRRVAESADDIARQARYLEDGVLFLRDGRIQALLPWQEGERFLHPQKGYRDLRGKLLLPGFVDAHVHYPQTEMIGAFGEQLLEWLTTYTFPVESQFADADYAADRAVFCQPAAEPRHHHRAGVLYAASGIGGCPV
jgi:guanine deaminase